MIPSFVRTLLALHPDLSMRHGQGGDMLDVVHRGALFSEPIDGWSRYRYVLWRIFDPSKPMMVAIMLNPSTADDIDDDPTILRMTTRARRLGYGGVVVINIFAWRDTSPTAMKKVEEPIGAANDDVIDVVAGKAGLVICGWGSHGGHRGRSTRVMARLISRGVVLTYLRMTAGGQPEHPLYLPYDLEPKPWNPETTD